MKTDVVRTGDGFTSRRRAEVLVDKGRAIWVDENEIEFIVCANPPAVHLMMDVHIYGTFHWKPKISGGYNVLQAKHDQ